MNCKKCKKPFPAAELLEGFCADCIFALAADQSKAGTKLSREAIQRAKQEVDGETAGLFSPGMLDTILEELLTSIEAGEDRDLAKTKAINDIQSVGGIGACREMIKMADGLTQFGHQVEEEARRKLGVLMKLRKDPKLS